ncbi:hypothetical protein STAS_18099, partial [Striga asiatica]
MKKKPVRKSNPILKLARGLRVSDCEIQIRPSDKECSPAPRYNMLNHGSTSKFFTVTLEFGGKFDIGKKYSAYLGGSTILFDYVDYERVTLADFKSVAEFKGCKNPMRLHTYVGCGSFMLLSTETDLESVWQRQINKVREVSLFVEELSENTKNVNAPEIENEVGEDDSDETFEWENDSEVDKLDDILFDENVDEVEVEVGVEAEEGEVEGEGEKGEGEGENGEGEGEGETELGVEKGELGVEIEAEKVDEGEESDEDLNQVVDEVAEFMAKNGGFDADGGVGGESEESEDSEESDDDILDWEYDMEADKVDEKMFDDNVDFDAEWLHGQGEGVKKCANDEEAWQVIKYTHTHTCAATAKVKNITSRWLAGRYAHELQSDPDRKIKGFRDSKVRELRARRMTDKAPAIGISTQESVVTGEGQAHKKRKEVKKQTTVPKFIQAPSMYNQYTSAQLGPTSGVNIRGPPTFQ